MPIVFKDGQYVNMTPEEFRDYNNSKSYIRYDGEGNFIGVTDPDLQTVKINGQAFRGISDILSVNTKTYAEEPTRAGDGSIPNINDYITFIVPRVRVNFKYFNIDDYMRYCRAIEPNEFYVEFFDKQYGKRVTRKMYVEPEEMKRIHNIDTKVIGVLDFEASMIGTLNDQQGSGIKITYNINGGGTALGYNTFDYNATWNTGDVVESFLNSGVFYKCLQTALEKPLTDNLYWENIKPDMIIGKNCEWGEQYTTIGLSDLQKYYTISGSFLNFNTRSDNQGFTYYPNQNMTIHESLTLYCIWE